MSAAAPVRVGAFLRAAQQPLDGEYRANSRAHGRGKSDTRSLARQHLRHGLSDAPVYTPPARIQAVSVKPMATAARIPAFSNAAA